MTKLHVYNYMLIDPSFNVGNTQRQLSVYAACETQKRAAELFGVTSADMRTYGGIGGLKAVQAMCHAEPDQVFVEIGHGRFARMQDMGDQSKWFDVDLHDEDLHGRDTIHPAFGQIDVHRIHGSKRLFAVDYPQDHFIRLTVHTTKLNRNLASDRTFSEREVIVVDMSEVQWARLIASPNTSGVACTLARYIDPETGEYLTPQLPEKHVADAETFKDESRIAPRRRSSRLRRLRRSSPNSSRAARCARVTSRRCWRSWSPAASPWSPTCPTWWSAPARPSTRPPRTPRPRSAPSWTSPC
jgi:hypothetical protein